ncbi:MAG: NAD(P)H-dependent oxidoreductase, partial [Pseudomonadota bacterium]
LHGQIQAADAIIIATPEYNGNLPGVLKNAFDWVSRCKPMTWGGKPTAIMSAAAGRAGGIRGQNSLRFCLTAFQPHIVHGPEIAVAGGDAFDDAGQLTGEMYIKQLTQLMDNLRAAI